MKIKSRVYIIMILPILLGSIILIGQYWNSIQLKAAMDTGRISDTVTHNISIIAYLTGEFALYPDSVRVKRQLAKKMLELDEMMEQLPKEQREHIVLLQRLRESHTKIQQHYREILEAQEAEAILSKQALERQQYHVEMILLQAQTMMTEALKLDEKTRDILINSQKQVAYIMYFIVLLCVALLALLAFAMGRRITKPLLRLKESATVVGSGNLDHRIGHLGADELGEVGDAFDAMVERLKLTLASRDELDQEVNERRKIEATLRRREHSLAEAQRIAQLGSWEWDILHNNLTWSEEVYRIFGLSQNQFPYTYEAFLAGVHAEDRETVVRAVDDALAHPDQVYRIEHRIVRPDDSERTVLEQGEVTFDLQGNAVFMMGTVQDITQQKQAEKKKDQEVKRKTAQQQALIEIAHTSTTSGGDFELIFSAITELSAVTLKAERVSIWIDIDKQMMRCVDLFELTGNKHSNEPDLMISAYPTYFEVIKENLMLEALDVASDTNTRELYEDYLLPRGIVSILSIPVRTGGDLKGMVCYESVDKPRTWHTDEKSFASAIAEQVAQVLIDHERRLVQQTLDQTRRYLNNIVDSMPSMVIGIDAQGRVNHWNKEASRITSLESSVVIGRYLDEVLEEVESAMEKIMTSITEERSMRLTRLRTMHEGNICYWDVIVYPVKGEGGVVRIEDITERVQVEGMMAQSEKMLSIGGLAAGMAHELNNPLASILQSIQNIQRRLSPELAGNIKVAQELDLDLERVQTYFQQRQLDLFLDGMAEASKRAAGILTNLLKFSGKGETRIVPEDIVQLVERVVELASMDYDLKKKYDIQKIEIVREYQSSIPLVSCVATDIQQVILSLLRNAVQALHEFHRDAEARIAIRIAQEGDMVRVEIADNGPGMDVNTRKRIFEPFFTTRPVGQGTGLGLSVSYYIVHDEHHGELKVESSPGEGSTFILLLPLEQEDIRIKQVRDSEKTK